MNWKRGFGRLYLVLWFAWIVVGTILAVRETHSAWLVYCACREYQEAASAYDEECRAWDRDHRSWIVSLPDSTVIADRADSIIANAKRKLKTAGSGYEEKPSRTRRDWNNVRRILGLELGGARVLAENEFGWTRGARPSVPPIKPARLAGMTDILRPWVPWFLQYIVLPLILRQTARWVAAGFKSQ